MNFFELNLKIAELGNNAISKYVSTLIGFPKPANDTMYGIILLLSEMNILLSYIFLAVVVVIAYIYDVYRASENPYPRHFEKSVEATLDVIFVIFPTIIILYLLVPSLGFIFNNELEQETAFALDIIGHQWYWSYEYNISIGISLFDSYMFGETAITKLEYDSLMDQETTYNRLLQVDKRVVIPVNTKIAVALTSQDVIHSWAMPQLGIKVDAIPGRIMTFILESNITGVYYGQCSELCGVNHAFMPICVQTVEADVYLDWVLCSLNINPSAIVLAEVFPVQIDIDELIRGRIRRNINKFINR